MYGKLLGFYTWKLKWGVDGASNLHYNAHNSFKNWGSIPLQVTTISMNFLLGEWKKIMLINFLNMHNLCMYL